MMNICVIGNSHVACLKKAWDTFKTDDINIDFFAHQAQGMSALSVNGNSLVSTNDKLKQALIRSSLGKQTIIPAEYNAVVLVGLGLELLHLNTLKKFSHAVKEATYSDYVKQTLLYSLAEKVRSISNRPLYILHAPLKAKDAKPQGCKIYIDSVRFLSGAFSEISDVNVLLQPLKTVVEDRFTSPEYAKAALKLDVGKIDKHHIEDGAHMNADFGKLWLDDLLAAITESTIV